MGGIKTKFAIGATLATLLTAAAPSAASAYLGPEMLPYIVPGLGASAQPAESAPAPAAPARPRPRTSDNRRPEDRPGHGRPKRRK